MSNAHFEDGEKPEAGPEVGQAQAPTGGWLAAVEPRFQAPAEARKRFAQRRLGEILISLGSLTDEQRDRALERQKKLKLPFGEVCRRMRLISKADLDQALALQFGYLHPVTGSMAFGNDLVMASAPFGEYAEALRAVANRLISNQSGRGEGNVMAVTSAEPGEGRSHVAANLAVAFSQAGVRTLLVDADLRHPRQHSIFGVPQHPGFGRLLCGFAPEDVVRRLPELSYLALITSGPVPPNPSELLGRPELKLFMRQAGDYYDMVVVDTPAQRRFADAEMIATAAGSALVIVRQNQTRQRSLRRLTRLLAKRRVRLVGTLINAY